MIVTIVADFIFAGYTAARKFEIQAALAALFAAALRGFELSRFFELADAGLRTPETCRYGRHSPLSFVRPAGQIWLRIADDILCGVRICRCDIPEVRIPRSGDGFPKRKKPEVSCKTSGGKYKNGRQVSLSAVWRRYSVVRKFKSIRKGEIAVLHIRICNLKSRHSGSKKPR